MFDLWVFWWYYGFRLLCNFCCGVGNMKLAEAKKVELVISSDNGEFDLNDKYKIVWHVELKRGALRKREDIDDMSISEMNAGSVFYADDEADEVSDKCRHMLKKVK